jgi:hypothetical protein
VSFLPILTLALLAAGCASTTVVGTGGSTTTTGTTSPSCEAGCGATGYCHWVSNACQDTTSPVPVTGTCQPRPEGCDDIYAPVCGCDGQVYGNACAANQAGVDVGSMACPASATPDQYIPCGTVYCDPSISYCLRLDGGGGDVQWECQTLPSGCAGAATPACACFGTLDNGMVCSVVQGSGKSGLEIEMPAQ